MDSGWILSAQGEKIMLLSPTMKSALYTPNTLHIMSPNEPTHLSAFRRQYIGPTWSNIYAVDARNQKDFAQR